MKDKIIIIIIILIVGIPIIFNELKEKDLRDFKKEVLELADSYEKTNYTGLNKTITINKDGKSGNIFITEDGVSVILDYKGYCAVKWPGIDVALAKTKCPSYELKNGEIIKN